MRFIERDGRLREILSKTPVRSREDLEEVIISGALDRLAGDTMISRKFLRENFEVARMISQNIGGLADLLNQSPGLAASLVQNGQVLGARLIQEAVREAAAQFSHDFPLGREFFDKNPALTFLVLQSPEFTANLKDEVALLSRFFGPNTAIGPMSARLPALVSDAFQSSIQFPDRPSLDIYA